MSARLRDESGQIAIPAMLFLIIGLTLLSGLWTLAEVHMLRTQMQAALDASATAGAIAGGYIDVTYDASGNVSSCAITMPYRLQAQEAASATWAKNAALFAPGLSPSWKPSDISYSVVQEGADQGYQVTATLRYVVHVFGVIPYGRSLTESATAVPSPPPGLCP